MVSLLHRATIKNTIVTNDRIPSSNALKTLTEYPYLVNTRNLHLPVVKLLSSYCSQYLIK